MEAGFHQGSRDQAADASNPVAYHVLRDGVAYEELGTNYYDERKKNVVVRNAVQRLERLGYKVTVEAA